jgi:hypothetical protein
VARAADRLHRIEQACCPCESSRECECVARKVSRPAAFAEDGRTQARTCERDQRGCRADRACGAGPSSKPRASLLRADRAPARRGGCIASPTHRSGCALATAATSRATPVRRSRGPASRLSAPSAADAPECVTRRDLPVAAPGVLGEANSAAGLGQFGACGDHMAPAVAAQPAAPPLAVPHVQKRHRPKPRGAVFARVASWRGRSH